MIAYIINRQPETETKGKAQKIKENPQNESTPIDVHYLATEPALVAYAYNPSTQEAQTRAPQVLGQPDYAARPRLKLPYP